MTKTNIFTVLLIMLNAVHLCAQNQKLQLNEPISGELKTSESSDSYQIALDSAYFVYGKLEQKTMDGVVKLYSPENKFIEEFDKDAKGPDFFMFKTKEEGNYRLEVVPFKKDSGEYSIEILKLEPVAKTPEGKVDQLLIGYTGDVPGAEVLVFKEGKTLLEKAYGMANLSYNIPFKTTTPTNIGSTSKQFTAMAIMLLQQQGKLNIDDDVRKYFPELPEFDQKVTLRNLLTHTNGYREYLNLFSLTGSDLTLPISEEQIIRSIQNQSELQNEPGTKFNYNNTAFVLLSLVVERVTDMPFPEWMKENVFNPLNMNDTRVRASNDEIIPNRAAGYKIGDNGKYVEVEDLQYSRGAGGIYTTLPDFKKWIKNFKSHQLGGEEIYKAMTTPFVLKNGDTLDYGFGLFIDEYQHKARIQHGGADNAHRSMLMYFPEFDGAVIMQSNNAAFNSNSMANKIADIYFKEDFENTTTSEPGDYNLKKFDKLIGEYALDESPNFILSFMKDGNRIYTQASGQPEINLVPESDSIFKIAGVDARVKFHLKKDGTADHLTLMQNGNHTATKIASNNPEDEEFVYDVTKFEKLLGKYSLEEMQSFVMSFMKDGDRIYTQATGQPEIDLIAESDSLFKIKGVNAKVKFHLNNNGTADSLTLIQHGMHKAQKIKISENIDLIDFTGSFYSAEIETVYHIHLKDEVLEVSSFLFPENIKIEYLTEDTFSGGYPIESLKYLRNNDNEIIGFEIDNGRTNGVKFVKMNKDFFK
ncbi:serine hydrolase domain-containing protein [Zunongwangia sp. HRR-M8]|uniref:serine hydrolase domain-containing protein n=1 Tax=Zunongwangia sp. HRR-M8 TaxID=3015170 RepID=UPI0022DD86ED|nr:serine hydrolase domain-containing protein [Zunongwangia sp. HRR-M8]WBL21114.1 serine hydrolase [Zunongwangia sp. HRR-M8]